MRLRFHRLIGAIVGGVLLGFVPPSATGGDTDRFEAPTASVTTPVGGINTRFVEIGDPISGAAITLTLSDGEESSSLTQDSNGGGRSGMDPAPAGLRPLSQQPKTTIANVSPTAPQHSRLWVASLVALWAANGLDAYSSWDRRELNPVLANKPQEFGWTSVGIKAGLAAFETLAEIKLRKQLGAQAHLTLINFTIAGVYTGIAAHNIGVPQINKFSK